MFIKILFLCITVVSARTLNSVTDTDNSDVYNKQAKLDFETTTTNEIIIPPHSHDSHENSHEVTNGPYDVKKKSDNPVSSFNLTSDNFHDHFNVSDHKLHELNHSFPNHELGPGYEADDTYFTNKDVKGFDKRIDDIFKDTTTNTGNPSFGMGPLETELENSEKDQSNRGFLGSNFGFSSIGSPKFEFELQAPRTISESQNTFNKKMSERLYKRDLESFNIQNRDEREQHNLRSLHQQRMNQNQYLESLIADNKRKFESEAESRGTFTISKQTRNINQNTGYESQYDGSRQQFQSNFDKETTNHFERRDTVEENNGKETIDRRKQSDSDHRRRHQSQMGDSNTNPANSDLENSENIGRNKEHQIHRPMQNSNKRNDDFDVNSSRHRHGNKNRDEKHNVQQKFENAGYNNNKNTPESNYTMLVASSNRKTNDSRSVKESPQNGVKEIETNNKEDFKIQNKNARNDQRPVMKTTTDKEDLKPKEKSDDGEKDRWVWSGEKMNETNNTHNEELRGKTTTLGPDLDDRAAFNGDKCPTGKAKIGNTCVNLD